MNLLSRFSSIPTGRRPRLLPKADDRHGTVHRLMRWIVPALVGIFFTAVTGPQCLAQLKRMDNPSFDSREGPENQMIASTVRITAAGAEGGELMELRIDDTVVGTWTVGGDANSGQFEEFVYNSADTITADQVRIYFTNDLWEPTQSIDRKLQFSVDDSSGRTVIKVLDPQTDEIIRQIPSEEVLRLAERIADAQSLLFDGIA